jgi:hypothetical protein
MLFKQAISYCNLVLVLLLMSFVLFCILLLFVAISFLYVICFGWIMGSCIDLIYYSLLLVINVDSCCLLPFVISCSG